MLKKSYLPAPYIVLSFVLAALCCLLNLQPAHAVVSKSSKENRYIQIPILYITDRAPLLNGYSNQRKYEVKSIYDLYFGTAYSVVDNPLNKTLTDRQEKLGWKYLEKLPKQPMTQSTLPGSGEVDAFHKFGSVIADFADKAGTKDVFLYLPGFNNTFAISVHSAIKTAYYIERPVVLYSWPSAGRIVAYAVDSCNNEWSQEHYNRLMEELIRVKDKDGIKFNVLAHSMGNRLVVRASSLLKGSHLFQNAFLVDPDLDAETFVHYIARYAVTAVPKEWQIKENKPGDDNSERSIDSSLIEMLGKHAKLLVFFSHRDNALPLVDFFFGGYTRAGQGADTLLESLFDPSTLPNLLQGASNFMQQLSLLPADPNAPPPKIPPGTPVADVLDKPKVELTKTNEIDKAIDSGFEWIDYTVLDHGILGHKVPFEMISNIWATNTPGDGLALVQADNSSVNRLTRLATGLFKQRRHLGDVGTCQKVVFEKNLKSAKNQPTATNNTNGGI